MCGICGFNFDDQGLLKKMCKTLIHRGPDDSGFFNDSSVSIGMTRLSIIDLETGAQPQHNEDESIWIVFNGEIYNYQTLSEKLKTLGHKFYSNSDTEVILHAYEEWGENSLKKLRGQFAFCIFDSTKKILFLARDHMGLKPIYFYSKNRKFIFGSEIKSILVHSIRREINRIALNLYMALNYTPFNDTLFKNIYKLPPSSYLVYDLINFSFEIKKYWKINFNGINIKSERELANELLNYLEESVQLRLISDVPLGAFLSGGIDSSTIVALMSKNMNDPVRTYSVNFDENAPVNESKYAKIVSDFYGTEHTQLKVHGDNYKYLPKLVWHLDDLISDPAILPVFIMSKLAKDSITVALTGDGADEIFAGYSIYNQDWRFNSLHNISKLFPYQLIKFLNKFYNYIPSIEIRNILYHIEKSQNEEEKLIPRLLNLPENEINNLFSFPPIDFTKRILRNIDHNLIRINQLIKWDLEHQLPNQYNMKLDKMSMAASLETRIPFLDYKIVEFSTKIPPDLKIKNGVEKFILRLAVKDLLPKEILIRKKQGFGTPNDLWLKTVLKDVSYEKLNRLMKRKELINPIYVNKVIKYRKNKKFRKLSWNLLLFEIWYETFIEKDDLNPINIF